VKTAARARPGWLLVRLGLACSFQLVRFIPQPRARAPRRDINGAAA